MGYNYEMLPVHMREGTALYVEQGVPPGGFLFAVLSNDLVNAFGKADQENQAAMRDWCMWLYWHCPADAWGSRAKVLAWIEKFAEKRGEHA